MEMITENITKFFSKSRLNKYEDLIKTFTKSNVSDLYNQNKELSESFLGAISLFEVFLRNTLNEHIKYIYKPHFGIFNCGFIRQLPDKSIDQLQKTISRIDDQSRIGINVKDIKLDSKVTADLVVSRLSFGFWPHLFASTGFSSLWGSFQKSSKVFPNITSAEINTYIDQKKKELEEINSLRNRICHHEIIINLPLDTYYTNMKNIINDFGSTELTEYFINHTKNIDILIKKLNEKK